MSVTREPLLTRHQDHIYLLLGAISFILAYYKSLSELANISSHYVFVKLAVYIVNIFFVELITRVVFFAKAFYANDITSQNFYKILSLFKCSRVLLYTLPTISAIYLLYFGEKVLNDDSLYFASVYFCLKYFEYDKYKYVKKTSRDIGYGGGMACNYYEGFLSLILPNNGGNDYEGIVENMKKYEDTHNIYFPVKRLFIIIPKSLYCPPDMKNLNKNENVPHVEACKSLLELTLDRSGVKGRSYKNTPYKIFEPPAVKPAAYVVAEFATPLLTLFSVKKKKSEYQNFMDVDFDEIVEDFIAMLKEITENTAECRGLCELIYFDDTDKNSNLASTLLEKIRKITSENL